MLRSVQRQTWDSEVSLFCAGLMCLLAGVLLWLRLPLTRNLSQAEPSSCATEQTPLTAAQLAQLTDRYGATKADITLLLGSEGCLLPTVSIRADAVTERSHYRLENGSTVILAYEESRYVGHSLEPLTLPDTYIVQSDWEIQSGDEIAGYPVVASLGELTIAMRGEVFAPASGTISDQVTWSVGGILQPLPADCAVFMSPQLPTYLSKLCGLRAIANGSVQPGQSLAQVHGFLHLSLLTLRPGANAQSQWRYVAPSPHVLAQFLGT